MSRKTRNDTLSDEGQKRINMKYLPSWNDDNMPSLSDNNPTDEGRYYCPDSEPFDANQIDDDFFDELKGVQVLDRNGRIVGEKMQQKRKHMKK